MQVEAHRAVVGRGGRLLPLQIGLVCPTMWDEAELPSIAAAGCYGIRAFGSDASEHPERFDAHAFIDSAVAILGHEGVDGVMASDDYPGSIVAAVIAQKLGLPGPAPAALLLCQHKYYSRIAQREVVPEAVPDFMLVDPEDLEGAAVRLEFPVFIKPVKSFFSLHAQEIKSADELEAVARGARQHLGDFVKPFNQLLERYTDFPLDGGYLLAERLLCGHQVTVEGCVFQGGVAIIGIVDSIMYPGTISFRRFEYPSVLSEAIRQRMEDIAMRFIRSIGFDNALFNVEMIYDPVTGGIHVIEINPRMCPQFADLMEKVNGVNTYEIALDIAAGRRPTLRRPNAKYRAAASLVARLFDDRLVRRVPSLDELARFAERFPDARLKVLCREGHRLSDELQDGKSYRYALVNLGGESRGDVLARYEDAMRQLPFTFASPRSGA